MVVIHTLFRGQAGDHAVLLLEHCPATGAGVGLQRPAIITQRGGRRSWYDACAFLAARHANGDPAGKGRQLLRLAAGSVEQRGEE